MINIEVNTNGNIVHCSCEVNIEGTRAVAIGEFRSVLDGLYKSDKLILALALAEFIEDSYND